MSKRAGHIYFSWVLSLGLAACGEAATQPPPVTPASVTGAPGGAPGITPGAPSGQAANAGPGVMTGKLEAGVPMPDLAWASRSNVACFPATENARFRANHVLFHASLPPRSTMTITVIPKDPAADLSVYAYTIAAGSRVEPPQLPSAVSCEADFKWDRPKQGRTQDHTRTVRLNAIQHPYEVVIGVSGPAGATGEFEVKTEVH